MVRKNQTKEETPITEKQTNEQASEAQAEAQEAAAERKPLQLRYTGKTIKHFDHEGKMYQLMPNTVYLNLPVGVEQVKRLIENKELIEV